MKRTILLVSLVAAALAQQSFVAVAQEVPTLNVGQLCRAEGKAAPELAQACMADEKKARDDLVRQWAQFAPDSKARCTQMATGITGVQSYVELLTCLQMTKYEKSLPKQ
jgi:hypothetical protein